MGRLCTAFTVFAALFLTPGDARASIFRDEVTASARLPEDGLANAVSIVGFDGAAGLLPGIALSGMALSGITADTISGYTEGVLTPFLNQARRPPDISSAVAAAAVDAQAAGGLDSPGRAALSRVATVAAMGKIWALAFAGWVLSFVVWQILDTFPQSLGRMDR